MPPPPTHILRSQRCEMVKVAPCTNLEIMTRHLKETQTHSYLHLLADLSLDGMSGFPAALAFRRPSFFHLWHRLRRRKEGQKDAAAHKQSQCGRVDARSRRTERATRKNARTRHERRGLCYVTQHLEPIQFLHPSSLQLPEINFKPTPRAK